MRVAKLGDGLAVCLPAAFAEALGLKEGDDIEIDVLGRRPIDAAPKPSRAEITQSLLKFRGRLPADYKFDRHEANAR